MSTKRPSKDATSLRIRPSTKATWDRIRSKTGMTSCRLADVFSHAWALLTDEEKRQALAATANLSGDGVSQRIWFTTIPRINEIHLATGAERVRLMEAFCQGWLMLDATRRDEAIKLSMSTESDAATNAA